MKTTRRTLQAGFLILTLVGVFIVRGNAERWCPFGGVEAIYTYVTEGNLTCSLAVSNFYILGGVILMTLLLRRVFCGYMCPVGTFSDWLHAAGSRFGIRRVTVPRGLDRVLSLLKYPLLAVILYFTYATAELVLRGFDPCYALISRHGEDITFWAYVISAAIVLGSLAVVMPFCRWLCPLAAVLNPMSRVGVARVKRNEGQCAGCGECSTACPMAIPVDELHQVTAARCLSCLRCVDACPTVDGEGGVRTLAWGPPGRRWAPSVLVALLLACTTTAVAASYLFPVASFVKVRGQAPATAADVEMHIVGLSCRGNANLLWYFLERDDLFEVPGYLRLQAWPGPAAAKARVTFDSSQAGEAAVKQAITEPYFDAVAEVWRFSPFAIDGYDPLDLGDKEPSLDP